jgi:hypothetical protein
MTSQPDEPRYRFVMPENAHPELVEEEFELFKRLMAGLGDRVPPDATDQERNRILAKALEEDDELAAIADRFEEVTRSHEGSVIRGLMEADRREEGEDD